MDFYEEIPTDVTPESSPAPVAPVATPEPTQPAVPTEDAKGGDTPPVETDAKTVPYDRFSEVNKRAKDAEERAAKLEADLKAKTEQPDEEDDVQELDPAAEKAIARMIEKRGYVKKDQVDEAITGKLSEADATREIQKQVDRDVEDLGKWAKEAGYPDFDRRAVAEYANKLEMSLGSKEAMRLAYKALHNDAIEEATKKAYLAELDAPKAVAERPGSKAGAIEVGSDEGSVSDMIKGALKSIRSK